MSDPEPTLIADAVAGNWVDRSAPSWAQPYLKLSRLDRPIGTWLLLLPCWWSIALAAPAGDWPDIDLILLFGIGAVAMRGAGCTFNDIVDRRFDALVERTRHRPLPSGQVSLVQAVLWMLGQALAGLVVLLNLKPLAIMLGIQSLMLVAIYPFMKRVTWWPQVFLGLAFNWGAVMGWAAVQNSLALAPAVLYLAGIAWTLGYDTIYAHQDKEDDALIGVKSTARLFGTDTPLWLIGFYGFAWLSIALAGSLAGLAWPFFVLLLLFGATHLTWQVMTLNIDDSSDCLAKFRANRDFGLIVFLAIVAGRLASG